jgi:hypothetical protein
MNLRTLIHRMDSIADTATPLDQPSTTVTESVLRELQAELKSRPQVKQTARELMQEYYSYVTEYGGVGGYGAASQAAPGATSTAQKPDPAALQQKTDQSQIQKSVNQIKPKLNQLGAAQPMNPTKFIGVMNKLDQDPGANLSNQEQNQLGPLAVAATDMLQNQQTAGQFKTLLGQTQQIELQKNKQVQQAQKSMGQTPTAGTPNQQTPGQPAKTGQPTTPAPSATTPPSAGTTR